MWVNIYFPLDGALNVTDLFDSMFLVSVLCYKYGPVYAEYNHEIDTTLEEFDDPEESGVYITGFKIYTRLWYPAYKIKCIGGRWY